MTAEKLERARNLDNLIKTTADCVNNIKKCTEIRIRVLYQHFDREISKSLTKEQIDTIKHMTEAFLGKNLEELKSEFEKL
jgi:aminoglycoside phosphotransferase family enzyme